MNSSTFARRAGLACAILMTVMVPRPADAQNANAAGVPLVLAEERAARVTDIRYELHFSIPNRPETPVKQLRLRRLSSRCLPIRARRPSNPIVVAAPSWRWLRLSHQAKGRQGRDRSVIPGDRNLDLVWNVELAPFLD